MRHSQKFARVKIEQIETQKHFDTFIGGDCRERRAIILGKDQDKRSDINDKANPQSEPPCIAQSNCQ